MEPVGLGATSAALEWLVAQQDADGRWANRYPYAGKMHVDIDRPRAHSRWVTLRACLVLRMVAQSGLDGA